MPSKFICTKLLWRLIYTLKKVIDKYVQDEDFDQVFFLDDSSGNYTKVQAGDLNKLAGNKIWII